MPLKICVVGAGAHCRKFHLPALVEYQKCRGGIQLDSVCDLDQPRAREVAAAFGFRHAHAAFAEALRASPPDVVLAITPPESTLQVCGQIGERRIPILLEKPLGESMSAARELVALVQRLRQPAMVSMNRRFDPLLAAAWAWVGGRKLHRIEARMSRDNRREPRFLSETGIHIVDAVCSLGGRVEHFTRRSVRVAEALSWELNFHFAGGLEGCVRIAPQAGINEEWIALAGEDFRVEVHNAEFDSGLWSIAATGQAPQVMGTSSQWPLFVANGTYAETCAFLDAAKARTAPSPSPQDVLEHMAFCDRPEA